MMQIYLDAIQGSMTGSTQYVLQNGMELARTSDTDFTYDLLDDEWEMKGMFKDGICYEVYEVRNPRCLQIISAFIKEKLAEYSLLFGEQNFSDKNLVVYYTERYDPSGNSQDPLANMRFSTKRDEEAKDDTGHWVILTPENSARLKDYLSMLGIKQSSEYWKNRLGNELGIGGSAEQECALNIM